MSAFESYPELSTPDMDKHLVLVTDLKDTVKRKVTAPAWPVCRSRSGAS
jgi:hypothetical protein